MAEGIKMGIAPTYIRHLNRLGQTFNMITLNTNQCFSVVLAVLALLEVTFGLAMDTRGMTNFELNSLYIGLMFLVLATLTLVFYFWTRESRMY
jgi:hypothetical protein